MRPYMMQEGPDGQYDQMEDFENSIDGEIGGGNDNEGYGDGYRDGYEDGYNDSGDNQ